MNRMSYSFLRSVYIYMVVCVYVYMHAHRPFLEQHRVGSVWVRNGDLVCSLREALHLLEEGSVRMNIYINTHYHIYIYIYIYIYICI